MGVVVQDCVRGVEGKREAGGGDSECVRHRKGRDVIIHYRLTTTVSVVKNYTTYGNK